MAAETIAELPQTGFVRERELIPNHVPFSHATLWRQVKAKRFPAPVRLSDNITAWRCADVHAWLESREVAA